MGRVLRLPRPGTLDLRLDYPLILEPNYAGHYLWVWLRDHDHQRRRLRVDRLVVCSFSDQPYGVFDVVHLDRDNRNCRLENLVRLNRRTVLGPAHSRRTLIGVDDAAYVPTCRGGLVADKTAA